jgi:hypothetical protein
MKSIYKYLLDIVNSQSISIPQNSQFLRVGEQNGKLMLWVEIDTMVAIEPVNIEVWGTGHPMPDTPRGYIDSCQMSNGLVWHVYFEAVGGEQ